MRRDEFKTPSATGEGAATMSRATKRRTTKTRKLLATVTLATLAAIATVVIVGVAAADNVSNTLDTTIDAVAETMPLNVGGANGTTRLYVDPTSSDGKSGCNLTGSTTLTISLASSDTSIATVSPSSVTFTSCVDSTHGPVVTVTPVAQGTATITATQVSNTTLGTFNLSPVAFDAVVAPPPNTAPHVSVTGVTGGASYEIGSVPAAGCSATDAEDGNSTFAATLSAVSGPLAAHGVGDQTATCSYTDTGGLNATSSLTYSIVDTHAPSSTASATSNSSPYTFGTWTNHDVVITLSGSDGGSGLNEIRYTTDGTSTPDATHGTVYAGPFTLSSEGTTTLQWAAIDNAGNVETAQTASVMIDKTAPTISCGTADGIWHAANVSIACTASDSRSGLGTPADASFSLSTSVDVGAETNDAATGSHDVFDAAGNKATAGPIGGNMIDRKAPTIANAGVQSGTAGSNGWYISAVSNGFTASDGGSGLSSSCDIAFPKNVSTGTDEGDAVTVVSGPCTDAVGNSNLGISSDTFKIDLHSPTVSCDSADTDWHAANVSIACTASDGGSGLATPGDASFLLSTSVAAGSESSNASTGTHDVTDLAGRTAQAGPISGNKIDRKAPQQSSCDSADGNWHAANVTLQCTYTDGGSGPASQAVSLTTAVADGVETANAAASAGGVQACDNVNNCAPSPDDIGGNKIDRKAPVISCGSADSVWHGADQSVTCTATDAGSDLAVSGDASFTLSTNVAADTDTSSAMTGTHLVADGVGNSDTAGPVGPFKIDKKAPTYTCDAPPTVWSGSDITINCTAADSGSGLDPAADASFSLSTNVSVGTETSNASTGTKTLTDAVGHITTAGPITGLKVDKRDPTIAFSDRTAPNGNGWNNTDVTVNWACSDGGSGVVSNSDSKTLTAEGANLSATGTCTDNVGHTASDTQTGINIDRTAPSVVYTSAPAPNGAGWYKTDVVATFTATDTLSGFAGPSTTKTGTSTTTGEGLAVTVGSPAFTDLAGNSVAAGAATSDAYKIDKTKPDVAVTGVTDGSVYQLGSVPAAGCSTTDALSLVKTNAALSSSGGPVGSITATCSGAEDNAGNTNSASATYTVDYKWTGFFQPIDNDPICNSVKAGSAIPVKFSLNGYQGMNIFASGYPKVSAGSCTGATVDPVEETSTAGNSSLNYDATSDQYIYVWKTDKSWAGTAKRLTVVLADGTTHFARFTFTK
jgi:Fn3 domain-containing protein